MRTKTMRCCGGECKQNAREQLNVMQKEMLPDAEVMCQSEMGKEQE